MSNKLVKKYLQSLKQRNFAKGTIEYRSLQIGYFLEFIARQNKRLTSLNREDIYEFQRWILLSDYSTATRLQITNTIRDFLRFVYSERATQVDLSSFIVSGKGVRKKTPKILTLPEISKFLSLPDITTHKGIRDKAMFELLYSSAIRRQELVGLNLYDFSDECIRVLGKGRKERIVPVGIIASRWIGEYLKYVRPRYARPKERALFVSIASGRRIHPISINQLFKQYSRIGGFRYRVTPHMFRHSCATHMIKNGANIRYIQELLGHSNASTTEIYTTLDTEDLGTVLKNSHPRGRMRLKV